MPLQLSSVGFCLQYKLCKVRKIFVGTKGIPHLVTHDARTIRYPDPLIKVNDTVQIDLETGKITDFIKFDTGGSCIPCKALCSSPLWSTVWTLNAGARYLFSEVTRQSWQPWERGFSRASSAGAGAGILTLCHQWQAFGVEARDDSESKQAPGGSSELVERMLELGSRRVVNSSGQL